MVAFFTTFGILLVTTIFLPLIARLLVFGIISILSLFLGGAIYVWMHDASSLFQNFYTFDFLACWVGAFVIWCIFFTGINKLSN